MSRSAELLEAEYNSFKLKNIHSLLSVKDPFLEHQQILKSVAIQIW